MIRKACKNDLKQLANIYRVSVRDMIENGISQWDESYPTREHLAGDIEQGELYVDEANGGIRGAICLNCDEAEEYAVVSWRRSQPALVIHRMAVNLDFRKQGVAQGLLGFAEELAEQQGLRYIKTDTFSMNFRMNTLFVKCGFEKVGEIHFMGKAEPFYCYDKYIEKSAG